MQLLTRVIALLLACSCAAWGVVLDAELYAVKWNVEDGLPQGNVQFVTQTADGFLWLATLKGLARFDGEHFKAIPSAKFPGLPGNGITCLHGDTAGRLWIGAGERLFCYDDGEVTVYTPPEGSNTGNFEGIVEPHPGELYALSVWSVSRIETSARKLIPTPNPLGRDAKMTADSLGRIWISTGNTLCLLVNGEWKVQATVPFVITCLAPGHAGAIWCGTDSGVVAHLGSDLQPRLHKIGTGSVYQIIEEKEGSVLIRMEQSFYQLRGDEVRSLAPGNVVSVNTVQHVFKDREGNLWLGTNGDGLYLLRRKPLSAWIISADPKERQVTAIAEDLQRRIWVGTMGGLVMLENGRWSGLDFPDWREIGSLLANPDGSLWVAAVGRHLWRWQDGQRHMEMRSRALAGRALFADNGGNLWVGGDGLGVECFSRQGVTRYFGDSRLADRTRCFVQDRAGNIWVGAESGLGRIQDGRIQSVASSESALTNAIHALYADSEGALWIGTERGLTRFKNGHFVTMNSRQGIPDDLISQILEDNQGFLWLGCTRGLFRARKQTLQEVLDGKSQRVHGRLFGKADGMRSLECTRGCLKSRDGRLWFGTADGLIAVDPAEIPTGESPGPVHIQGLDADGTQLFAEDGLIESASSPSASLIARSTPFSNSEKPRDRQQGLATVPPGARRLDIHFTALNFSGKDRIRFRYRLKDYESKWTETDSRHAAYTQVPPGSYVFQLEAANSDGAWSSPPKELRLLIQHQIWQTATFRGAGAATLATLLFVIVYGPIHRRRQMERLRIRIARDLHDEVGSHLGTISLYNQLAQAQSASGTAPENEFKEINRVIQRTAQSLRDVIWFTNPEFDTINGMVMHMEDAAKRSLTGKSVVFHAELPDRNRGLRVEFRRNMFSIFREILHNLQKHSQASQVKIDLWEAHRTLFLRVTDDGAGFDPITQRRGHGLRNIEQRAREMGGRFEIQSQVGRGACQQLAVRLT